jgi:hypothetical protein
MKTLEQLLNDVEQGALPSPDEIKAARKEVAKAKEIAKHARQIYVDGQLDKYPTSDSGPEYELWRLVKRRGE